MGRTKGRGESFQDIAEEYVAKLKAEGRADTTIAKIKWLLEFAYQHVWNRRRGLKMLERGWFGNSLDYAPGVHESVGT